MSRKSRSYYLKAEGNGGSGKRATSGIANPAFVLGEPELTQLAINKPHGGKQTFYASTVGCDTEDHRLSLGSVFHKYQSNPQGLDHVVVEKNRTKHGPNIILPPEKPSEILKFCQCSFTGLNTLFWICGILSLVCHFGQYLYTDELETDNLWGGVSLLVIVLIAGCFTYYQERKSSKIMESFKSMAPTQAILWRDGQLVEVNVDDIVVGDIIELKAGDRVPADMRLFECSSLKVDNSMLTGESEPQKRSNLYTHEHPLETANLVFFSTNVIEGSGKGIAINVGQRTFMGRVASLAMSVDSVRTPIAREMDQLIRVMTVGSLSFGIVFFLVGLYIRYTFLQAVFFAVGIIVANVPESLNVTLTIILALTAQRMAAKNCLVKHLHAVETLGSVSVICSDKTGTLTQNRMSVAHLWVNAEIVDADIYEFPGTECNFDRNNRTFSALTITATLCSRAKFLPGQENVPILRRAVEGDSSEAAILRFMELNEGSAELLRMKYPKVFEIPFNSRNKFQVSVHEDAVDPRYLLVMKGAPEKIVSMCSTILVNEIEYQMNEFWKKEIDLAYATMGGLGERVLGFCDCRLSPSKYPKDKYQFDPDNLEFLTEGFRFVGLISMIDPPRPSVPEAVRKCREAGIRVIMVTGDHPITATAIARAVGIFSEDSKTIEDIAAEKGVDESDLDPRMANAQVVTGAQLENIKSRELEKLLSDYNEIVFARTTPEQKHMVVSALQRIGHAVAVTGDGVNDAPALKQADIGIAMGITGTDAAKETADMILLDDNFASIVTGVADGRLIFDNLRKLFRFVMADNIAQMYCYWIFILLKIPLPMATIPMLLSTSGTDILPAISLAYEKPEADIMKLKPRDRTRDTLITKANLSFAYGQVSVIETFAAFFVYCVIFGCNGWLPNKLLFVQQKWDSAGIQDLEDSYGQEWTYDARVRLTQAAQTGFFVALVTMQLINAIACKTRRLSILDKKMKNPAMNIALVMAPIMAIAFMFTPYINNAVSLTPLISWEPYVSVVPFALLLFFYDETRRWILRRFPYKWIYDEFYA